MMGIAKCPFGRQRLELNHWVAEGSIISPRWNAHVLNATDDGPRQRESGMFPCGKEKEQAVG